MSSSVISKVSGLSEQTTIPQIIQTIFDKIQEKKEEYPISASLDYFFKLRNLNQFCLFDNDNPIDLQGKLSLVNELIPYLFNYKGGSQAVREFWAATPEKIRNKIVDAANKDLTRIDIIYISDERICCGNPNDLLKATQETASGDSSDIIEQFTSLLKSRLGITDKNTLFLIYILFTQWIKEFVSGGMTIYLQESFGIYLDFTPTHTEYVLYNENAKLKLTIKMQCKIQNLDDIENIISDLVDFELTFNLTDNTYSLTKLKLPKIIIDFCKLKKKTRRVIFTRLADTQYSQQEPIVSNIEDRVARIGPDTKKLTKIYNTNPNVNQSYNSAEDYIHSFDPELKKVDELISSGTSFNNPQLTQALIASGLSSGLKKPQIRDRQYQGETVLSSKSNVIQDISNLESLVEQQFNQFILKFDTLVFPSVEEKMIIKANITRLKQKLFDDNKASTEGGYLNTVKKNILEYEYNLIKIVFEALNNFYRANFFDEFIPIKQSTIVFKEINEVRDTYMRTNNKEDLKKLLSKCVKNGSKDDFSIYKNQFIKLYGPIPVYSANIKQDFIILIAELLDNYPIDIDINQEITRAKKNTQTQEYIYGYTVILRSSKGVLYTKECELAIPDGGFDEIGKQMTNQTRIKQIREERSICKHGDTITASFSRWFKGGRNKTRKLNKNKLKRTKRYKKKTNRHIPKKQRKTHKRR